MLQLLGWKSSGGMPMLVHVFMAPLPGAQKHNTTTAAAEAPLKHSWNCQP